MSFLWPPRPEKAIPPDMIPFYERNGYLAQIKKNGTCSVISTDDNGNVEFWNRHKELHKAWMAPDYIIEYFKKFPNSTFVAELLHNKSPSVKNTIYIFDVLIYMGTDLVGETLKDRLTIIDTMPANKGIILVQNYYSGFRKLYDSLSDEIDEGLVFKDPNARLKFCFKDGMNSNWQVKCRKITKNYGF